MNVFYSIRLTFEPVRLCHLSTQAPQNNDTTSSKFSLQMLILFFCLSHCVCSGRGFHHCFSQVGRFPYEHIQMMCCAASVTAETCAACNSIYKEFPDSFSVVSDVAPRHVILTGFVSDVCWHASLLLYQLTQMESL